MAVISLIYLASLIIVIWAIVDIVRQPSYLMSRNQKLVWGLAAGLGWFLLGVVGVIVAAVYLIFVRSRLRSRQ